MTLTPENLSYLLGLLGLLGIIFTVANYLRKPQIDGDKRDALLAQQIKFFIDGTETRFKNIQESFQSLLLQSNNHIHTVETKVDGMASDVGTLRNEITRLSTVIEERIPKK